MRLICTSIYVSGLVIFFHFTENINNIVTFLEGCSFFSPFSPWIKSTANHIVWNGDTHNVDCNEQQHKVSLARRQRQHILHLSTLIMATHTRSICNYLFCIQHSRWARETVVKGFVSSTVTFLTRLCLNAFKLMTWQFSFKPTWQPTAERNITSLKDTKHVIYLVIVCVSLLNHTHPSRAQIHILLNFPPQ